MAKPPKVAAPVWPNAGVDAWYRAQLQGIVTEMSTSMLHVVRGTWREDAPDIGFSQDGATLLAAGIMFRDLGGRILLLHRRDGEGWAFPGGGLEYGETPADAASREAGEETGWAPFQTNHGDLDPLDVRETRGVIFHTFAVRTPQFRPVLNAEHDRYVWVTPSVALSQYQLHPGVRATLRMVTGAIARDANPINQLRKALEKWGGLWIKRLDRMSLSLARQFAAKNQRATQAAMQQAFSKAGFTVAFRPTSGSVQAFESVVAENVNLIKSIPQQYLKDVQTQVWQAVMKGSDLGELSKGIQQKYGVAYRRAALIARDQNAKAKAVIENTRRQELGIKEAIWQHSAAGKEPRPTHVAMNGKRYALGKGMYDKAEKEWIWPGQLINCRCTSRAVIPGFE